ncbi:hypothetical protein V2J09_018262 [Rumex salicifolius]
MLTIADLNMGSPFTMAAISSAGPLANIRWWLDLAQRPNTEQLLLPQRKWLWAPPVSNLYDGVFVSEPALEIVGGCYL